MKNIKTYILFFILYCQFIHITATPWYLAVIKQSTLSYQNKCLLINAAQAVKKATFITNSLLAGAEYLSIKNEIDQKKIAIKNSYLQQEQKILCNLEKSLHFSPEQWSNCLNAMKQIKNSTPQETSAFHDQTIPQELYNIVISLLSANGINPYSIHLQYEQVPESQHVFAQTINGLISSYHPEVVIENPKLKQTIVLYKHICQQPISHQLAIIAHEIEHICKKDGLGFIIIEKYLRHYHQKNPAYLEQNNYLQQLTIIYEAQAEIFAALKDSHVAQALVDLRAKKFYPGHLYEAHYHDLVEINNLWRIEAFLKKTPLLST